MDFGEKMYNVWSLSAAIIFLILHVAAVCGGDLIEDSGHLESPNFPDEYLPSKECIWKITVPENYQVKLVS